MDLKTGLWQQQTLKLAMTQELTQAIALLQYSTQELTEFLEAKALENPLFTIERRQRAKRVKTDKQQTDWVEQIADTPFSLEDDLIDQLDVKKYSIEQLALIRMVIRDLDENGYFRGRVQELAEKLHVPQAMVERSIAIIQTLEPAGIGATCLQECLLLQVKRKEPENELAITILENYFFPFAEKKWKMIAKELQVTLKEIQAVSDFIQKLNPKPCAGYTAASPPYLIPDAVIEWDGSDFSVRLWEAALPKIEFNTQYYQKFSAQGDRHVQQFLQEKYQDYQWIAKSIEQRKETVKKVVLKIVEKQLDFFRKGPEFLQPMTMKEMANELAVHESTISRAVREKYVQTPNGTFPLKFFFTSTVQTVSDESTSSSQVKNLIARLVDREDKQKPYSDQELVDLLKDRDGILLSRRTVAKYRDQLGIPSSAKRKRY
ncbi:RNA polymerase factor sigma-54 [Neobacillus sp. SM06]|uniref:RNA polymerase factor sigma-54 n=1 Tax=Neobacillus sp. SM06 TaxID=3422492 RepID=UPI003D27EF72